MRVDTLKNLKRILKSLKDSKKRKEMNGPCADDYIKYKDYKYYLLRIEPLIIRLESSKMGDILACLV
jgi:hypothetical protein